MQNQLQREYLYNPRQQIIINDNPEELQYNINLSQYKQMYGNLDQTFMDYQPRFNTVGVQLKLWQKNTVDYQVPFVGETTYNQHYKKPIDDVAKRLNPELEYQGLLKPAAPSYPEYSRIKFEGESTYKSSYGDTEAMVPIRLINS